MSREVQPGGAEPIAVTSLSASLGGQAVLRGVDLSVPAGSVVTLLGPSGCGKTTLLRCVAGLLRPDSGEVRIGDRHLSGPRTWVRPERRRVGMVFQEPALFPHMSVAANVGYGLPRRARRGRVEEALRLVGLDEFGERLPEQLSGGQQQRVALARALAPRPAALLLDEPFSALDAPLRAQLRREVRAALAQSGATALFVTHDQEEAFLLGDMVAVMHEGTIAQLAPPAELYRHPASSEVARFLGDANVVLGIATGDLAETPLGAVPLEAPRHGPVDVVVRPEQVGLEDGGGALVEAVEYYGHDAVYLVRAWGGPPIRARELGAPRFAPGDAVRLSFTGVATAAFGGVPDASDSSLQAAPWQQGAD